MANRTFKVYGQAYAESGDVTAVLTVGGTEVFNGTVNDSTTVRDGEPTTENHLFSFELDENTTGNLSYSLAVSGGELCLGPTHANGTPKPILTASWVDTNIPDATNVSAAAQAHVANTLGESALGTDLYNALLAGTVTQATDEQNTAIYAANIQNDFTNFFQCDDIRESAQIDGVAVDWSTDEAKKQNWVIIEDGSTFTCTWNFSPETIYN